MSILIFNQLIDYYTYSHVGLILAFAFNSNTRLNDSYSGITHANCKNGIVDEPWQANVPFLPTNGWTASRAIVPVSAAVWLFSPGLLGLIGIARKKKTG